ncbi:hypothetical protein GT045_13275 [Streptomyces sp. SID486]|nr:hypothetical protein [Streptomyces sp. SID486]
MLAVLIGLLGMHALAPGGGTEHTEQARVEHARVEHAPVEHIRAEHGAMALGAMDDCPGGDGHCGGGRLHHADPTCASGALADGPQLPALAPAPAGGAVPAGVPSPSLPTAPDSARAPPSLAELQLLRI